jgi:pimeloyl-ACP methyl ester carboxylesterase
MGGAVAQRLALDRPERVRRLALLATGAKIPVTPVLFDLLVPGSEEAVIEMFKGFAFGPNTPALLMDQVVAPLHEMNLAVLRDDFIACREWQANERVAAITAPTLVVAGDLDQLTPVKRGRFLAETIPGARLEILPETGHMLPVERIREVAALLASHFGE